MSAYWVAVLPLCMLASSAGPGLLVLRRLPLAPLERVVCSIGLSFVLLYGVAFTLYAAGAGPRWHLGVAAAFLGCSIAAAADLLRLARRHHVRRVLAAHLALLLWGLLLLSFVRHFGGGTWSGDWLEHYQRTLFFLEHRPLSTLFIDQYLLPTRPPMMNVLAAHFLAVAGPGYEKFQLVLLYLNALALPACCLVAGSLFRPRRPAAEGASLRTPGLVLLFLAGSPFFVQNLTYSWTKLFAAFYVVLSIHLYLRGIRKPSRPHVVLAFFFAAAGCLVHYSAAPYALFLGLHYLVRLATERERWSDAAMPALLGGALLATWVGWSLYTFGPKTTFGSNSTVSDSTRLSGRDNAINVGRNAINTIVPTVLRRPDVLNDEDLRQPSTDGQIRDFAFLVYQVSLPFALGSGGLVLAAYLLVRAARGAGFRKPLRPRWRLTEGWFWALFVPFTFALGVAVYGGVDRFGVAHVTLQPLVLLGLTALAAGFDRTPLLLRRLLVVGLLLDFAVGIQLHFNLQNRDFPLDVDATGSPTIAWTPSTLSHAAQFNWLTKQREGLVFWGDRFKPYLWPMQVMLMFSFGSLLVVCLRPYLSKPGGGRA